MISHKETFKGKMKKIRTEQKRITTEYIDFLKMRGEENGESVNEIVKAETKIELFLISLNDKNILDKFTSLNWGFEEEGKILKNGIILKGFHYILIAKELDNLEMNFYSNGIEATLSKTEQKQELLYPLEEITIYHTNTPFAMRDYIEKTFTTQKKEN